MNEMNSQKIPVIESSGNVFADLGLTGHEELSVKAQLVLTLTRLMKLHRITQRELAGRCGTDQPTVSKVLRGQLDKVTVDRLLFWLSRLNQDVQITVSDRFSRADGHPGRIAVFGSC